MPLPLTVSCSSKIQIGFTFLVPAYPGYPGKEAVKWLLLLLFTSYRSMSAADAGAQQQTRRPHVSQPPLLSMEETDGRTDGHATVTLTLFRILHGTGSRNQEIIGFWDGSGFDRTIFKQAAPCSGQNNHANITSRNLYRLDAIPDAQPTVSKH